MQQLTHSHLVSIRVTFYSFLKLFLIAYKRQNLFVFLAFFRARELMNFVPHSVNAADDEMNEPKECYTTDSDDC